MKALIILCLLLASLAHAGDQLCRSQLLKVTVANNAITGVTGRSALQFLRNLAPSLQELLKQDYSIDSLPLPAASEECQRLGLNCPENYCQDSSISPDQKKRVCFALPCPIIEGTRHVGKCDSVSEVFGKTISFPEPVSIKRLRWEVKTIDTVGKEARICFRINDLALSLAARFEFDTSRTRLPDSALTVSNIAGELDQPKVTWNVVRGSEQGWLKDPVMRAQVTKAIDKSINEAMSKAFRIPFASATSGFMAEIPLKAEGRTKAGNGYFGVCLKEDR